MYQIYTTELLIWYVRIDLIHQIFEADLFGPGGENQNRYGCLCEYGQGQIEPIFVEKFQQLGQLSSWELELWWPLWEATQKKGRPLLRSGLNVPFCWGTSWIFWPKNQRGDPYGWKFSMRYPLWILTKKSHDVPQQNSSYFWILH